MTGHDTRAGVDVNANSADERFVVEVGVGTLSGRADVPRRPMSIIDSDQGPALESAMHAAVAAGASPDIRAAAEAMGKVRPSVYTSDDEAADACDQLSAECEFHDHFGTGGNAVMRRLERFRRGAVAR